MNYEENEDNNNITDDGNATHNGNAMDDNDATDDGNATDDSDTSDDSDGSEDSSVNKATDNSVYDVSLDSDDMVDLGGAAAAGGGAGHIKLIMPTFTGEGSNIFEISTLEQEFIDSFLSYCQHAHVVQDKRLNNLDQCLTGVVKKWYRTETKFVDNFTEWNAFGIKAADRFGIELTPNAKGTQGRRALPQLQLHRLLSSTSSRLANRPDKLLPEHCLPATTVTCPARDEKIKMITDTVSQKECIDQVIYGLDEKMQEAVKKLFEGKSFLGNIYRLENSSTKPMKDPPQMKRRRNWIAKKMTMAAKQQPQQQPQFQCNHGLYLIQSQQFLPPPGMMLPPQVPGGGGGPCPPPA